MKTHRAMTVLQVSDLEASRKHFAAMKFNVIADHPEYGSIVVQRGGVTFLVGQQDNYKPHTTGWVAYVYVTDIERYRQDIIDAGIEDVTEMVDRPWAVGEFAVRHPDGFQIAFGEPRDAPHGPGLAEVTN